MKKILIVNSYYAPTIVGGAEVSTQLLAEGLTKHYQVYVLTTGSQKSGIQKEEKNGVKIYRIPCMNLYWPAEQRDRSNLIKLGWHFINTFNIKQYKLLKKLLVEIRPDIMHTQNLNGVGTYIWGIAKQLNIPTVHTTRDYALFEPVNNKFVNKALLYFNRVRSKHVKCVVGISEFILDKHKGQGLFPNAKENIVHNVVKANRYKRKQRKKGEPLIIGYFGQLVDIKGVHILIQAVQSLGDNIIDKLIICGSGPLEKQIQEVAEIDDRIVFRGKVPLEEVNKQMAQVDLTVVPSIWEEPFGRIIIESYNQGTPVIATKVGGIPELVINKDFLVTKGDIEQLMKSIEMFFYLDDDQINKNINDSLNESMRYRDNISLYNAIYKNIYNGDKFDG
ncbi:TPA: glycosyltransferase family 4 protein [Bacillus cereus]